MQHNISTLPPTCHFLLHPFSSAGCSRCPFFAFFLVLTPAPVLSSLPFFSCATSDDRHMDAWSHCSCYCILLPSYTLSRRWYYLLFFVCLVIAPNLRNPHGCYVSNQPPFTPLPSTPPLWGGRFFFLHLICCTCCFN